MRVSPFERKKTTCDGLNDSGLTDGIRDLIVLLSAVEGLYEKTEHVEH